MAESPRMIQANAKFKKIQREEEAKRNLSDYETSEAAIRAKTARLKAERLARDAAIAAVAPAVPAKKKSAKKVKSKSGSLSDWLKDRESSGNKS